MRNRVTRVHGTGKARRFAVWQRWEAKCQHKLLGGGGRPTLIRLLVVVISQECKKANFIAKPHLSSYLNEGPGFFKQF